MKIAFDNAQKGMGELIPALALLAPAFWVAWIELIYSGDVYLSANQPTSFDIIANYAISTTALSVALISFGCVSHKVETALSRLWVAPVAGGCAAAMTLWCLAAPNPVATAATGLFTAVLVARFSIVYSQVNPKASMVAIVLSQLVASFVYGYVLALSPFWRPVFLCVLPLIAGVLTLFDGRGVRERGHAEQGESAASPGFVRFVLALLLFSVALNVVRGFYPSTIEMDAFSDARGNSAVLFFFAKMAFAFIVLMLPLKSNLGKLSYYGLVALAILTLPLPLLGLQNPATLELFGCINALLNIVVWSLFAGIAYKSGRSPVRLMGWGWGYMSLGSVLGWLAGFLLYAAGVDASAIAIVEIVLLAVMLLSCMFVATWQVVDELFDPFDGGDDEYVVDRSLAADGCNECGDSLPATQESGCAQSPDCLRCPVRGDIVLEEGRSTADETAILPARVGESRGDAREACMAPGYHSKGKWRSAVFEMSADKELSDREADVMELLLKGYAKQRVAEELFIAYNTVRSHVRKVYVKCDVHSQQELISLFEREYLHRN